ncbi:SDR family oxidoreductase [Mycolicibacterium sp. XJ1819]
MEIRLDGKVALVTGASRGIGLAIARAFADAGAKVMLSSRKEDDIASAAAALAGEVAAMAANAGNIDDTAELVDEVIDRWGRLDVLVNNAATCPYVGPWMGVEPAAWDRTFQVNLRGPLFLTQQAWRAWMADNGGSVINIASIGGYKTHGVMGVYDNSKAALIQMTKHLAVELGPAVRVNAIAPGLVETRMAESIIRTKGDDIAGRTPMRRNGLPEDIAPAALFLASDASAWITGDVMVVDGGRLASGAT